MDIRNEKLTTAAEPYAKCREMLAGLTQKEKQALCEMLAGKRPYRTVEDAYNNLSRAEQRVMYDMLEKEGITSQL